MSTMSWSPKRWLRPPPQATAYFSKRRQPGVVLRVSRILACVPRTLAANCAVSVATPERRWTKFSATRSALRIARAGPEIFIRPAPALIRWPSRTRRLVCTRGESFRNAVSANAKPATTSDSRARRTAAAVAVGGTVANVVTSPLPMSSARADSTARRISSALGGVTAAAWIKRYARKRQFRHSDEIFRALRSSQIRFANMNLIFNSMFLATALLALPASAATNATGATAAKTYRNPLAGGQSFADPHVIRVDGKYYLYATTHTAGYDAFVSDDLVHWEDKGRVFNDSRGGAWAPDVVYNQRGAGEFYLY